MNKKSRVRVLKMLNKQAFGIDDIVNYIVNAIKQTIDPENPITSVLQLIAEGFIFSKFGAIGSIVAVILDKALGINVSTLWKVLSDNLGSFMSSNKGNVDLDKASSQIANQTISALNVPNEDAAKPFDQLRQENGIYTGAFVKSDRLIKEAGGLFGIGLWGLLKAIAKAALIGAGFSAGGNLISNVISPSNTSSNTQKSDVPENAQQTTVPQKVVKSLLKLVGNPSGDGEVYHKNTADINESSGYAWYITSQGKFEKFVYDWLYKIYGNTTEQVDQTIDTYFMQAIAPLKREIAKWNPEENIDSAGASIRIPHSINGIEMHTVKDLVDFVLSMMTIE